MYDVVSATSGIMSDFVALIAKSHGSMVVVRKGTGEAPGHGHFIVGPTIFVLARRVHLDDGMLDVFVKFVGFGTVRLANE